jgi:hypothetical protein
MHRVEVSVHFRRLPIVMYNAHVVNQNYCRELSEEMLHMFRDTGIGLRLENLVEIQLYHIFFDRFQVVDIFPSNERCYTRFLFCKKFTECVALYRTVID